MTLKGKILLFLKEKGIKKNDFFDRTGIAASNFKGVGLDSELGGDKIVKILSCYPELSPDWLLTDTGPMIRDNNPIKKSSDDSQLFRLYKEMEAKADRLLEENSVLKHEIRQLEADRGEEKFVPDASTESKSKKDSGVSSQPSARLGKLETKNKRF